MQNLSENKNIAEMLMFYNVENLFMFDEKAIRRHLPSNSGLKNWNSWRYNNKIHKIASVFSMLKEENAKLPMLIGLSEIQGKKPLRDLLNLYPFNDNYEIVHYESMDERGVDVALLYDKTKLELLHSEPISFLFSIDDEDSENYDTTRDVLFCKFSYQGAIINIFVCHLPSKRDKDINRPKRTYILKEIKERVEALINHKQEAVILCGDFNENPDDEDLVSLLKDKEGKTLLSNPFLSLYENKNFSTFHYNEGLLFDQIFISKQFSEETFPLHFQNVEIFKSEKIMNWDKRFSGRPFRTYSGTRYLGGYSDHFPVLMKFEK